MSSVILQAEALNLPESLAAKLRGKKVELMESEGLIIIKPVQNAVDSACGMFKSDGLVTDRFMKRKQLEKELESSG